MEAKLYIDRHTDLVERCKLGDRKAQYELYRQYAKAMYNVCMRILNHAGEAEDVLQEAFLDAFNNIGSFRQQSTFGAWLKQIVVNRSINHLRSRWGRSSNLQMVDIDDYRLGEDDGYDIADDEPYDEEGIKMEVERVRQAVQTLPEGYRIVLTLYLFEGYDHEEIGQTLGISESTSRSQYLRAKRRLLNILK
ncbi:RNA polymerase sigma factor [Nibrella viscosa]